MNTSSSYETYYPAAPPAPAAQCLRSKDHEDNLDFFNVFLYIFFF